MDRDQTSGVFEELQDEKYFLDFEIFLAESLELISSVLRNLGTEQSYL